MECQFCLRCFLTKGSLAQHRRRCNSNPRREKSANQFTKAKRDGIIWSFTEETKRKIAEGGRNQEWNKERREKHSVSMKKAVLENPDSYTASNVSGRVKLYEIGGTKVKGTWELLVAHHLNDMEIDWTNDIDPFPYQWNNKIHSYFPDFYLPKFDLYIEVKGYQTERDECKWRDFPKKLLIIKLAEIKEIREGFGPITQLVRVPVS